MEFDVAVGGVVVEHGDGAAGQFLEAAYLQTAGEGDEVDPVDEAIFGEGGGEVWGLRRLFLKIQKFLFFPFRL